MSKIAVISGPEDKEVIEEFFQLFKTPWEFFNPENENYHVLISTITEIPDTNVSLIIMYGAYKESLYIEDNNVKAESASDVFVKWDNVQVPIYGEVVTFSNTEKPVIRCSRQRKPIGFEVRKQEQRILRIGYNLFSEIKFLLTKGQPVENALIPTLDIHIAMLRKWIIDSGIELYEIPPVPEGYRSITCLTHDVDFIGIRQHFMDHSMWGFLYRATIRSLVDFSEKRISFAKLVKNVKAAMSLPLVFLKFRQDPWDQFDNYLELEKDLTSTYFFIPYKNRAGDGFNKKRDNYRAARYDVDDVRDTIKNILAHGCEAGVHGIDAWHDPVLAKNELNRLKEATGRENVGIRMHWLCRNESTFALLDQAGYAYDASFGYNDAVGFRTGTAQVYKPFGVKHLLELPLHIQDTALLGPGRMHSTIDGAAKLCDDIIESVIRYKGVLTILWHQRSLGPERLWGDFYRMLIKNLQSKNTWFATAGDIVDWFRLRRDARFNNYGEIESKKNPEPNHNLPGMVLRKYRSRKRE